jgi:oxygen-independent coproporphyrinogen-3 oxidase
MVARYEPVQAYVGALLREIRFVSSRVRDKCQVSHIHWGGGSPNILAPNDISKLAGILRHSFDILDDAEFAVEFDPRYLFEPQVRAFMEAGLNRVSLGVQDFNESVQKAINRRQSYEMTERTVKMFRDAEINSVNIDLVYGLPHQSSDSVERTIDQVLSLEPDRIALFGYAHLPSKIAHQRLIDTDALPGAVERFAQSNRAADRIVNAGYNRIGFDHFAKPDDSLVQCNIRRNFQGYTSDEASVLIGIGATAIGQLPRGYVLNAVPTGEYMRRVENGGIATVRGFELSQGDSARIRDQSSHVRPQFFYRFGTDSVPRTCRRAGGNG